MKFIFFNLLLVANTALCSPQGRYQMTSSPVYAFQFPSEYDIPRRYRQVGALPELEILSEAQSKDLLGDQFKKKETHAPSTTTEASHSTPAETTIPPFVPLTNILTKSLDGFGNSNSPCNCDTPCGSRPPCCAKRPCASKPPHQSGNPAGFDIEINLPNGPLNGLFQAIANGLNGGILGSLGTNFEAKGWTDIIDLLITTKIKFLERFFPVLGVTLKPLLGLVKTFILYFLHIICNIKGVFQLIINKIPVISIIAAIIRSFKSIVKGIIYKIIQWISGALENFNIGAVTGGGKPPTSTHIKCK